jgi:ribosome-binding factor A
MDQVNNLIHTTINEFLSKEMEMPINTFVTISKVETSKDLRHAKILISVIPDNKRGSALRVLNKNSSRIQKYLSKNTKIKFIPKINFGIDSELVIGNEMDQILDNLRE